MPEKAVDSGLKRCIMDLCKMTFSSPKIYQRFRGSKKEGENKNLEFNEDKLHACPSLAVLARILY